MKNLLIVAAIAAIPAFAATSSTQPSYYQRPVVTLASEGAHFTRTDGDPMSPSYQTGNQALAPSEASPNDRSVSRPDGNRTPDLFQEGRR
jgi:hypothetical protein